MNTFESQLISKIETERLKHKRNMEIAFDKSEGGGA